MFGLQEWLSLAAVGKTALVTWQLGHKDGWSHTWKLLVHTMPAHHFYKECERKELTLTLPRSWPPNLSDFVVNTLDRDSTSLWTSSLRQLNDLTSCDLARRTLSAAGDARRWEEPVYTQHRSSRRSPAATRGQVLSRAQVLRVTREASISQVTRLGQGSSWAQATLSFIITWWLTVRTLLSTNTLVPAERKLVCVGNI